MSNAKRNQDGSAPLRRLVGQFIPREEAMTQKFYPRISADGKPIRYKAAPGGLVVELVPPPSTKPTVTFECTENSIHGDSAINRSDAPKGYQAVHGLSCTGCAFNEEIADVCRMPHGTNQCTKETRADRHSVIFVPNATDDRTPSGVPDHQLVGQVLNKQEPKS